MICRARGPTSESSLNACWTKQIPEERPDRPRGASKMSAAVDPKSSDEDRARLLDLLHGYRATCIVVTALKLGLVDELCAAPMKEELLVSKLGAHLPSLQRYLRALRAIGLIDLQAAGICLTSRSTCRTIFQDGSPCCVRKECRTSEEAWAGRWSRGKSTRTRSQATTFRRSPVTSRNWAHA